MLLSDRVCYANSTVRQRAFQLYQGNRLNQQELCPPSCKFGNMFFGPVVSQPSPKIYEVNYFSDIG